MTEPSSGTDRLRRAVGYAITGTEPTPAASSSRDEAFDPVALIAELGGVDALRAVAAEAKEAGRNWPHPIPERLRQGLGAAQLHAAVVQVRSLIDESRSPVIRRSTAADPDDLRLLRDVPPHHGG